MRKVVKIADTELALSMVKVRNNKKACNVERETARLFGIFRKTKYGVNRSGDVVMVDRKIGNSLHSDFYKVIANGICVKSSVWKSGKTVCTYYTF